MKLTGNTILITGATSGIGLGLALRFHGAGNSVIIAGRRQELLESITTDHRGLSCVRLDVTDPSSIRRCRDVLAKDHPDLNVLINNAGVMIPEDLLDPTHLNVAETTVVTNLLGPIRMTHEFLPSLIRQRDPVVINVTSGRAFVPLLATPTYSATKAAVHSYTECLRAQLADSGLQVLEVVPPRVQTELMGQLHSKDAMPLEQYLDEVWNILHHEPAATEICVESVKYLRFAEANHNYAEAFSRVRGVR